jgi:RNA 2',3'-cyclic 3'-phosphodiesterase
MQTGLTASMRIFVALDIDDAIRARVKLFLDGVSGFASEARWVRPESMHVTLKFIGEKSLEAVEEIKQALGEVSAGRIAISFREYGFFPTAQAPRVFWIGIAASAELGTLAKSIDQATFSLGIPKEAHPFSPHLTLARRSGSGAPRRDRSDRSNHVFKRLQEKLSVMSPLDFGTMTAREFFLYQSETRRGGSQYTKIASFPLD